MRVLFNSWRDLAHPLAGGAEVVLDQLASGLVHRGHHVDVRCGGPNDTRAYPVHCGGGDLSQYLLTPLHHRRLGRRADVVVDVSNGMTFFTPLFDRSVPTVSFVHHIHTAQWGMYFPEPIAAIGRRLETDAMPRAYRNGLTVTVSPSSMQSLVEIGVDPDRIRVLPPAATLERVTTPRSDTPVFVTLGRLTAHKRVDLLLEMWERVRPVTGGELVIIGDGPERARLEALEVAGTRFVGSVDEHTKASLLASSWTLVHAASHEGWGLVITEAGLAGVPSLGFDVAGVRDAIVDGVTGRLADGVDSFVERWIEMGTSSTLRAELGAGAHHRAASAKLETRVDVFEATLEEAITLHRGRKPGRGSAEEVIGQLSTQASGSMLNASLGSWQPGRVLSSVIIPAFDEAERLPVLLGEIGDHVDLVSTEVIVVDDGSTDATAAVAHAAMAGFPHATVLRAPTNMGKGAALRRGMAAARGEAVVFMDADMATDLSCLRPLIAALVECPVAIGSRAIEGATVADASFERRLMGGVFNTLVRTLTSVEVADSQCGFKAFRADVARLLFAASTENGFALDVELLDLASRLGLEIGEVPVRWRAIPGSKIHPVRDAAKMAVAVGRIARRSHRPLLPLLTLDEITEPQGWAKEVRDLVRAGDPIFVGESSVTIVLPGLERDLVDLVGARLEDGLGVAPRRSTVDAGHLFAAVS